MKAFLLFGPEFLEWPLAICQALQEADPRTCICGLAAGPKRVFERIMQTEGLAGAEVHHLDSLERQWIAMPARPGARARYEAMLGADIFQRLVIADRHLGRGYISGGETAQSPLSQLVRDPETLERYLVGLIDYVFETKIGRAWCRERVGQYE